MLSNQSFHSILNLTTQDEIFNYLIKTFKPRLVTPSYLVNWDKVQLKTVKVEMALHQLDYILGKPDLEQALFDVLKNNPSVIEALPAVFATRDSKFAFIPDQFNLDFEVETFIFSENSIQSDADIMRTVQFCEQIGFFKFLEISSLSSFTDFVYGIETGLDSNARKNRSGTQMENVCEHLIKSICLEYGYDYISQATASKIKSQFDLNLSVDKTNRTIDFAINTGTQLFLIEVNFYGSGGSKLKATAGEYKSLYDHIEKDGHNFIWITDGKGWKTAIPALRETFEKIDYILNLDMVSQGILANILEGV